jgi:membrane associated rhomboid family serine protease
MRIPYSETYEKRKFYHSLVFPAFFLFVIWFMHFIQVALQVSFVRLGVFPQELDGLIGILTSPLIHANLKHLADNSIPVFLLSLAIFYFYREIAYKIFFLIYFFTGSLVWLFGREAYHIGASGLVYGFAAFLFLSGVLRKNRNLLAISLLVIFLYGGLVWGLLPYDYSISWESHLMGALTGFVLAVFYRHHGPEKEHYSWEDEPEDEKTDPVENIYVQDSTLPRNPIDRFFIL